MTPPRVLVVVNSPSSGPRRLASWLVEDGIEIVQCLGSEGIPDTLDGVDGLVLLGGGFMPDDDARAPWLATERGLVKEAIKLDLPTLGICLGAQLIAASHGGEVRASYGPKERGSTWILTTSEGTRDFLFSRISPSAPMIENHQDMITRLPDGAVLLARSEQVENQAFVIGAHVRGVQFHPEASAENLANWNDAALRDEGFSREELTAAAEAHHQENTRASRALMNAFADEVHVYAEGRR